MQKATSRRVAERIDIGPLSFRVLTGLQPPTSGRPPIVLIHGIGMSQRYLSRLHAVLAEDGPVFSIDLPGFAGLPKPGSDLDVEAMARALAEIIDRLGIAPAVLVGHSMGAQWVSEVARERPDLVARLVLIGPVADAAHRTLLAQARALAVDSFGESPMTNAIVFTDYVRCGVPWYLTQARHMISYPLETRVAELTAPVLIIRGSRDPIAGLEWCRRLRAAAADAALVLIPGACHVAQRSAPRAVAGAIAAFLGAHDGGRVS